MIAYARDTVVVPPPRWMTAFHMKMRLVGA